MMFYILSSFIIMTIAIIPIYFFHRKNGCCKYSGIKENSKFLKKSKKE
jgi:hypothetical protein